MQEIIHRFKGRLIKRFVAQLQSCSVIKIANKFQCYTSIILFILFMISMGLLYDSLRQNVYVIDSTRISLHRCKHTRHIKSIRSNLLHWEIHLGKNFIYVVSEENSNSSRRTSNQSLMDHCDVRRLIFI